MTVLFPLILLITAAAGPPPRELAEAYQQGCRHLAARMAIIGTSASIRSQIPTPNSLKDIGTKPNHVSR